MSPTNGALLTFERFKAERYFSRLDGLRAVSILLVLIYHGKVSELAAMNGHTGVTIFFVISGFLITTLLLREDERNGKVALKAFYIRRVFRLLPLYYVALAATTAAVVAGFGTDTHEYWGRLPYFLTYMNEFAAPGTFGHSWSLAIEEKFYFVWPALAFAWPLAARHRSWLGVALLAATSLLGLLTPGWYFGVYAPILAGCVLAIVANKPQGFAVVSKLAGTVPGLVLTALLVVAIALAPGGHTQVIVGLASALAFPFLLFGNDRLVGWLGHHWLTYIGERAYAIYLFHPLVGSAVEVALPAGGGIAFDVLHLVLMFAVSTVVAEILRRTVEDPLRKVGHRLSKKRGPAASSLAAASSR